MQELLIRENIRPKGQILKWIGNKFRYANIIISIFPKSFKKFIEPFVGTGAILATVSPRMGIAGDLLDPLIEFWKILQKNPYDLISYYEKIINKYYQDPQTIYGQIKDKYNNDPNPLDLMIISRTCYGGVIRFTIDKKISTPIGPHKPISPSNFKNRALEWSQRISNTKFFNQSFEETMSMADNDDLIYCDPPYVDSQSILYGSQSFDFKDLIKTITECKKRGVKVVLSIDGKKKSGKKIINLGINDDLFKRELFLDCGYSMLKRFQSEGKNMDKEIVNDRLLLTW